MTLKDTKTVKIYNTTKSEIFTKETPGVYRIEEVDEYYRSLLNSGYLVYDVNAEGGFSNLSGKTAGKYVCVFGSTTAPTGGYTVLPSYTAPHTSVVISSIVVNTVNNIYSVGDEIVITTPLSGDYSNTTFNYCKLSYVAFTTGALDTTFNVNMLNTYFSIVHQAYGGTFNKMNFSNNYIDVRKAYSFDIRYYSDSYRDMDDSYIRFRVDCTYPILSVTNSATSASSGINTMNNTFLDLDNSCEIVPTGSKYINFSNVFVDIADTKTLTLNGNLKTTDNSTIYTNITSRVYGNYSYNIKQAKSFKPYDSLQSLNTGLIGTISGYATELNANYTYLRRNQIGELGNIKYQYYNIDFIENMQVSDTHKYFDTEDIFVTYRPDILTTLDVNQYLNYDLYKTGVISTKRSDESFFFLLLTGSTYNIVAYHKGKLYPTVYSSLLDNVTYTIVCAFQIWEFPEELQYKNKYNIDNSPMEGSFQVKDHTSRAIKGI